MTSTLTTDLKTKIDFKKIIQQLNKYFSEGNIDGILSLMSRDIVWDIPGPSSVPYTGQFIGHDGFRAFMDILSKTVKLTSGGSILTAISRNVALSEGQEGGYVLSTGKYYHYGWVQKYTLNEAGLIASMYQYFDPSMVINAFNS